MQRFKIVVKGQPYDIGAESEQEAIQKVMGHLKSQPIDASKDPMENMMTAPASGGLESGGFDVETGRKIGMAATPAGSIEYIGKGLQGTGPMTPMGAGMAAADIASLGLAGKLRAGVGGAELGAKGVGQAFASGAGAGAAGLAAQEMGAPVLVQLAAGILGGGVGGRVGGFKPQDVTKQVPKGQEAQALSRVIQRMGIPIETPKSSKPGDVSQAFTGIREKLGKDVGAAKEAMFQTESATPLIRRRVAGAGYEALKKAGVPVTEAGLNPDLTRNPAASKAVMDTLNKINSIPSDMEPKEAMRITNDLVEGLQDQLVQSQKPGSPVNLKGRIIGEPLGAMETAVKGLGPKGTGEAMDAADSAFAKLATLHDISFKSSKTMAQEGPRFNARKFLFTWDTMKPEKKASTFTPEEIAAVDFLVEQKDPNILMRVARKAVEVGAAGVNKLGILDLKHHPATRFKEKTAPIPLLGIEENVRQLPFFTRSMREENKKEKK